MVEVAVGIRSQQVAKLAAAYEERGRALSESGRNSGAFYDAAKEVGKLHDSSTVAECEAAQAQAYGRPQAEGR
jgi:hypothetical protein